MDLQKGNKDKSISIVVPIFNEVDNIDLLWNEIHDLMDSTGRVYEVLFVDDGSRDGSVQKLRELAAHEEVRVVLLRRNFGQTAAMHAGIQYANGDYIVTMDGDLQNDPANIPQMLEKLDSDSTWYTVGEKAVKIIWFLEKFLPGWPISLYPKLQDFLSMIWVAH